MGGGGGGRLEGKQKWRHNPRRLPPPPPARPSGDELGQRSRPTGTIPGPREGGGGGGLVSLNLDSREARRAGVEGRSFAGPSLRKKKTGTAGHRDIRAPAAAGCRAAGPHPPSVEPQPPAVEPHPPSVEPQPPSVESQPPSVEPQPPAVGRQPPSVTPQPPSVGRILQPETSGPSFAEKKKKKYLVPKRKPWSFAEKKKGGETLLRGPEGLRRRGARRRPGDAARSLQVRDAEVHDVRHVRAAAQHGHGRPLRRRRRGRRGAGGGGQESRGRGGVRGRGGRAGGWLRVGGGGGRGTRGGGGGGGE